MRFKNKYPIEERKNEANRVLTKYPDRIPVICEKMSSSKMEDIDKNKYLIPIDLTLGQFLYVIRKRLKLPAEKAVFLFINNLMKPSSLQMNILYHENRDKDGFLYIKYCEENVFG
tara:strand:+ start:3560 stop:3904 length:345 start_codon:yes stop_codon:yes gene_type:complete